MPRLELQKKNVPLKLIIFGLISSVFIVLISIIMLLRLVPSDEQVVYTDFDHPIIYNGKIYEDVAMVKDERVYLPFSFMQEVIDPSLQYDQGSASFILTTQSKVIQLKNTRLENFINSEVVELEVPAVLENDGVKYISYDSVKSFYPYVVNYITENGFVVIQKDMAALTYGKVTSDKMSKLRLRKEPTFKSPYVDEVNKNEQVTIEGEEESFYYVRRKNGVAGFLNKEDIRLTGTKIVSVEYEKDLQPPPPLQWPINLTWEAVYTKTPNPENIPDMPGLNVVSPTWFKVKNDQGDIGNLGSKTYSDWAHKKGLHVWGLFSNDFDPDKTHTVLKDFETRNKMIIQLLHYAEMYELDGLNLDFENVNVEDGPLLTQFARELTPYFHEAGMPVSLDITFISSSPNWSQFYEREKLAKIVDYLIVMAYDEHWASSPVAGSVASLPWVETNLQKLLEQIPSDRLILGIPFYTRIWEEKIAENGDVDISSKALSMEQVNNLIKDKELKPTLDKDTGQHYIEFKEEDSTFKIWMENATSIQSRIDLFHQYDLAGVASWNRYFASESAWNTISKGLNNITVQKQ
jgi:spore germination protein YaaH